MSSAPLRPPFPAPAAASSSHGGLAAWLDDAPSGFIALDAEWRCIYLNHAAEQLLDVQREPVLGQLGWTALPPWVGVDGADHYHRAASGRPSVFEVRDPVRGRWLRVHARAGPDGGVALHLRDVTTEHRASLALAASDERFREMFRRSQVGMSVSSTDGRYLEVNPRMCEMLGYTEAELIGRDYQSISHPDDIAANVALRAGALAGEVSSYQMEKRFVHRDGHVVWASLSVSRIGAHDDEAAVWVAQILDLTSRREAEDALRTASQTLATIIEGAPLALIVVSADWRVTLWNPAAERIFGWTAAEVLGGPVPFEDMASTVKERAALRIEGDLHGLPRTEETRRRRKDGSVVEIAISRASVAGPDGRSDGVLAIIADVTAQHALEGQLRHAQKMDAVGRLAGGIAHDFNNLLTVIRCNCELLLEQPAASQSEADEVGEIKRAADRAAELTRQLLAFSRKQVLERTVLDLNAVVADTERMLRRLLVEDVTLVVRRAPRPVRVLADSGQMEQVIVNLAVNGRDAMSDGGTLVVETGERVIAPGELAGDERVPPGHWATLSVTDTGCGMSDAVRAHIFEPFFTTKPQGAGTGLGLSTVYGIVQQSGGHVTVESRVGHGATFRLYFPMVEEHGAALVHGGATTSAGASASAPTETLLLVEDEDAVRSSVRRILQRLGYAVLEARNGRDALDAAAAFDGRIDLLVTDIRMPVMGGIELADQMRIVRPDTRVLYISGYTEDAAFDHGAAALHDEPAVSPSGQYRAVTFEAAREAMVEARRLAEEAAQVQRRSASIVPAGPRFFLQKPFTITALAAAVRTVLEAPRGDLAAASDSQQ